MLSHLRVLLIGTVPQVGWPKSCPSFTRSGKGTITICQDAWTPTVRGMKDSTLVCHGFTGWKHRPRSCVMDDSTRWGLAKAQRPKSADRCEQSRAWCSRVFLIRANDGWSRTVFRVWFVWPVSNHARSTRGFRRCNNIRAHTIYWLLPINVWLPPGDACSANTPEERQRPCVGTCS